MWSLVKKILLLQVRREDLLSFSRSSLILGLVATWIVGIGRYWDDPGASLLQHLGLGSVIYIFCLSAFILLLLLPLNIDSLRYSSILTYVSLTSFPALLYAIPVERFLPHAVASTVNVWFLTLVAFWRLLMLFRFLWVYCQLQPWLIAVITLLPVCLIVNLLSWLNLERAVFNIMGGLRETNANHDAYLVLLLITVIADILVLPLLAGYGLGIYKRRKRINGPVTHEPPQRD